MTWNPATVPDLRGRVAVVAGPHGPRGLATAARLALGDATVLLLGAGESALRRTRRSVRHRVPGAVVAVVPVDGDDPGDVVDAGERLLAAHPLVDLLVHSDRPAADVAGRPIDDRPARAIDATHTLALTATLLPGLTGAFDGRIVTVTPHSDLLAPELRDSRTTMRLQVGNPSPGARARWAAAEERSGRPVPAVVQHAGSRRDGTLGGGSDARGRRHGSAG